MANPIVGLLGAVELTSSPEDGGNGGDMSSPADESFRSIIGSAEGGVLLRI